MTDKPDILDLAAKAACCSGGCDAENNPHHGPCQANREAQRRAASVLLREMMNLTDEMKNEQYCGPVVSWERTLRVFAKANNINIEDKTP